MAKCLSSTFRNVEENMAQYISKHKILCVLCIIFICCCFIAINYNYWGLCAFAFVLCSSGRFCVQTNLLIGRIEDLVGFSSPQITNSMLNLTIKDYQMQVLIIGFLLN